VPTGYEIEAYRNLGRIASSLASIAESLERIASALEQRHAIPGEPRVSAQG
jgi:hypothetical protein